MRRPALLLLLVIASAPLFAAHPVSIAQLEQQLAALRSKPDADTAWQIADLQLTERLSPARLAQFQTQVPGEKSRQALATLAADSAFAPPPAAEIPATPPPSIPEQKRILALVVSYVAKTIPQLPNFVATRTINRYEDTPQIQTLVGDLIRYQPIHLVGTDSTPVLYQDGRETEQVRAKNRSAQGLVTWGVFGPILGTVLVDAAQSKLAFARWEQEPDGPRAVFAYAVPREKSHYEVDYCCVATQAGSDAANVRPFRKITPYRGEIAVDPATGIIRRLILQAELKPDDPINKADILVDYGPVEIAGRTYTCPLRSISRSTAQGVQVDPRYHYALANQVQPLKNSLNDTRFTDYHVFRGDTRLLAEAPPPSPADSSPTPASGSANQPPAGAVAVPASPVPEPTVVSSSSAPPAQQATPDSQSAPASTPPSTEALAASQPAVASIFAPDPPSSTSSPTLRITTRLVDLPVVAFDKKGRLVTDLTPSDLEIYDNGHRQQIRFFSHAGREILPGLPAPAAPSTESTPATPVTNGAEGAVGRTAGAPTQTATVLLIDAGNVAFSDLSYARSEMLRFLSGVAADERVGLYIMKRTGIDVLLEPTLNHAAVAARLKSWMPNAQDLLNAQHEEQRTRQSMEYVHSITDLAYVNGNVPTGLGDMSLPVDPQLRSLGDHPELNALILLAGVAHHLAPFPGRKSLVWVSSDNVLSDFSDKEPSVEKGNKYIDTAALRAREALNEAHVSIYPLDASQLEAGGVSSQMRNANVQLTPSASPFQVQELPPGERDEAEELLRKSQRDIYGGRIKAQLQQDTHAIQPAFRELAEATGGRALRRAGDIAAELNQIVADGREAYLLSFRPDQPPDSEYHQITVKCTRPGTTLRYRTGYFYPNNTAVPPAKP